MTRGPMCFGDGREPSLDRRDGEGVGDLGKVGCDNFR